jgi:hypothetical protein
VSWLGKRGDRAHRNRRDKLLNSSRFKAVSFRF